MRQIEEPSVCSGVDTGNLKASPMGVPERGPKDVRKTVWEQSLGAEGAAVLC